MKVLLAEQAWQDYQYLLATDKQMLKRINLPGMRVETRLKASENLNRFHIC